MKRNYNLFSLSCGLLATLLTISSCEKSDDPLPQTEAELIEESNLVNEIITEALGMAMTNIPIGMPGAKVMRMSEQTYCGEFYIAESESETTYTLVADFGNGCVGPDDIKRSGRVIFDFINVDLFETFFVKVDFDDFFYDDHQVEGTQTIKMLPLDWEQFSMEAEIETVGGKVTWPDGSFATTASKYIQKTYVDFEAGASRIEIEGNSVNKSRAGTEFTTSILKPLVIDTKCLEKGVNTVTSGIQQLVAGFTMTVDFGNGDCDFFATVTKDGKTYIHDLRQ